ncbi:MAG: hypothetical protein DWQ29_16740 [Planctomycetota bacterium]|nr:MAG: hypothetical protein DWQ29_16740 [Planctomycetota bacterium]
MLGMVTALGNASAVAEDVRGRRAESPSLFPLPVVVPRDGSILQINGEQAARARDARQRLQVHVAEKGSSSREELAAAIDRLPLASLSEGHRHQVRQILDEVSLFRRLPVITCQADPRVYAYFADNPDVAVSIWRVMGISEMEMRQVSRWEYESDLKDGTVGLVTVLHSSPELRVAMCEGEFKSPLLTRPIRSTGLLAVQTKFWKDASGRDQVTHQADMFVAIHSDAVETVARLISPVSFRMADRNFEEVTLFLRMMDEAMTRRPGWMEQTAGNLEGVLPGRDAELLELTAEVYSDASVRRMQVTVPPVPIENERPPLRSASRLSPPAR